MQAIILAAGMGRRLGEITKNNTKCMVPVNGTRLIDRVLNQLCAFELNRVIIVVGYKGKNLIDYIGNHYNDKLNIEFAENLVYDKTNNIYSLSIVKQQLMEDDTILIESDLIFEDRMFDMIINDSYPNLALVAKYESWMDGTMVRIDADNNIVSFVPRNAFSYGEVDSYYKTVNIYKFSRQFSEQVYVPFLEAYIKVMGNNEYYEQVLSVITLLDKVGLKALPIGEERWYEIDDVQDLEIAENLFADERERLNKYCKRYGGYWRFPKMLDFCYLVNPYFPPQRMKEEIRVNFDVLLTQYPSGMSVNSLLAGKYFGIRKEFVAVGNGAAELIKFLMETIEGKIGVVLPTFEEYLNRLDSSRVVKFIPNNEDLRYSAEDMKYFFERHNISTLLLINPDNPSGNFISKNDVLSLVKWCKEHSMKFIVDESFVDFTDDFATNSLLNNDILINNSNLIVIKSISKSYGVPGLRLGIMASSDKMLIDAAKKDVSIWNINSFAEFYMQIFNKYEIIYKESCLKFLDERKRFASELENIPFLRVIPSQANFFLCEVINRFTARELAEKLLSDFNILIKECSNKTGLKGEKYIRIAIRNHVENNRLIFALQTLSSRVGFVDK